MATPRVTVDEALALSRVTVTDTAPRVTVTETGSTSGVQVTATSDVITVSLSPSAAGVTSVNGITGAVTGIATTSGVASSIAAIDFPVDSVNGQTNTVVLTTSNVAEGATNKYFANSLARTAISATGSLSYDSATGVVSYTTPSTIASLSNHTTTGLAEGTNLYFTAQRAIDAVGGAGSTLTINPGRWNSPYTENSSLRGFIQWAAGGTNNLSISNTSSANDLTALTVSGFSTNTQPLQKWTASSSTVASISTAGVLTAASVALTTYPTTTNITEGTRLYYTDGRADARVAIGIANLVDSAPATLDTLNELAAALGDDPNYATTITTALGTKLATADFTSTANTWLGTKNTDAVTEGSTNLYYTDARVTTRLNNSSINELSDVVITSAASGQMLYHNGTNWVNTITTAGVDSPNLSRFIRTAAGGGTNAIVSLSRNRADSVRVADQGPWLAFEYVGTDNAQATSPQNAIRSMYDSAGNHKLQFLQLPGNFTSPTVMGQVQRGATFFNNTSGGLMMSLTDSTAVVRGTTTTIANSANTQTYVSLGATVGSINQDTLTVKNNAGTTTYATFASTGHTLSAAGLHTFTRTTTGTPGVSEGRPALNIQLTRTDQATPSNGDSTSFRTRVGGSDGTFYTLSDVNTSYSTTGNVGWNLILANGDQTTGSFSGLIPITSSINSTTIRAGTASATPGASVINDIMVITDAQILNKRAHRNSITTGTVARGGEYAVPVTANGSIELTITAGSGTTHIDVDAVASDTATGGMYSVLIYNNSGNNNIDVQVRNNGVNIGIANNMDIGDRAMASVYVVGGYAACEIMDAA